MKQLIDIQAKLKAPKGQYNSFGQYKYRSAEDILEAVKPLCAEHDCQLTLSDKIVCVGNRYYIEATAKLEHDGCEPVVVTAYAREADTRKGMDESQITGTASSYARKYALNGLFCIDDTKDADTDELRYQQENRSKEEGGSGKEELMDKIVALCDKKHMRVSDVCKTAKVTELSELSEERLQGCIDWIASQ